MFLVGIAIAYALDVSEHGVSVVTSSVEPFFMPQEGQICTNRLHADLENAQEKICIASYWLTHLTLVTTLRKAARRKVSVEIIFDKSTPNAATLQQQFRDSRIQFTESNVNAARMHHKFIVIDDMITWAGSANLTGTAFSKNYENMIRIESSEIAHRYLVDFRNLRKELSRPISSTNQTAQSPFAQMHQKHPLNGNDPQEKPISDYQKRILHEFGIDGHKLSYDQAYTMIDRIIHSTRRLFMKKSSY